MRVRYIVMFMVVCSFLWSEKPETTKSKGSPGALFRPMQTIEHTIWDGNLISTFHGNHGDWVSYHVTSNAGLEWPKGSGKTAVFQSGLWLASGKVKPLGGDWVNEIRTAAAEYTVEFVPGDIDGLEEGHIYEIFRVELDAFLENDFATYSQMTAELPITEIDVRVVQTVHFPTRDFETWPAHAGAPWVDADGDGIYNIEDGDHPDILGDQFHWYVMNDADAALHTPLWGTSPMNVEVQNSLFGFDQAGPLGNIMFTRSVIINRGTDEIDSLFISIWHDDDVGDATDDLVACDTASSLGYTYNDADGDGVYGVEAPASGSDFFQGPLVYSPGDTAQILTWSLENSYHLRTVSDYRQLPMTSFASYINGNPQLVDPNTAEEAYRYMNGYIGLTGEPFIDPITQSETKFVFAGDPVTGTGWIDGIVDPPGDRRFLMSTGPVYFAPGDTIDVVGCMIIAAGSNWAKSITKLRYFDNFAQAAFDANFDVCSPPIPAVSTSQLDKKIVLTFEEGSEVVEDYNCSQYYFEGYNIYQGESLNGPFHRIATYDVVNDIKVILDLLLDETTGELIEVPAQFGDDSGLRHHIEITSDVVRSMELVNGRKYYFAVTAYAYDPEAAQRVIESPAKVYTVIPSEPGLGAALSSTNADTLDVAHVSGLSDAVVQIRVVDPYQLTNDNYSVSFATQDSVHYWYLVNTTDGDTVISDRVEFPITTEYYDVITTDGLNPGNAAGTHSAVEVSDGFVLSFESATFDAPTRFEWATQTVDIDEDTLTRVLFLPVEGTWSFFLESVGFSGGATGKSELQKDVRFVFTEEAQKGYYWDGASGSLTVKDVPFEIWTVEDSTRINVMVWVLTGGKDVVHYEGPLTNPATGDTIGTVGRFWNSKVIPIYEPYTESGSFAPWDAGSESMGWKMVFDPSTAFLPGDELVAHFNNPIFTGTDEYTFTGSGLTVATEDAMKAQAKKINVFPNPYFGKNIEERNPLDRYVTFTHMGVGTHTVRLFSLSGDMVRRIEQVNEFENEADNVVRWDLRNDAGIPVASGMYIAYIHSEVNGKTYEKTLKLAVFMPEERLDVY